MNRPRISIIIPVYKAEDYLHRCVDSILSQRFTDFEVLLINDGSPDRSGEICDEYAQKDIRIRVFHKENGGVSSARQCGLDHAQGEYTIHADPDDWVEPSMLEELYRKAQEEDADMVICDFFVNAHDKQIYQKQQPSCLDHYTVQYELFRQLHGSCCNKLVKRTCYQNFGVQFPDELSFCEDLYVNTALLKNKMKVSYLPQAFYHYDQKVNPNSLVNSYSLRHFTYDEMLLERFSQLTKNTPCHEVCINNMCNIIVWRAFKGNVFGSKDFRQKCGKYRTRMLLHQKDPIFKLLLNLSCLGFYRPVYSLFQLVRWSYRQIKK